MSCRPGCERYFLCLSQEGSSFWASQSAFLCIAKRVTVNGVNSNRTVISEKIHANYVWFTYGNYDKIYL